MNWLIRIVVRAGTLAAVAAVCAAGAAADRESAVSAAREDLPPGSVVRLGQPNCSERIRGVYGIVFAPHGRCVATRSLDQMVRLWDPSSGALLLELEGYRDGRVSAMEFSHDGAYLVTASTDANQAVLVWDASTGEVLARPSLRPSIIARCGREFLGVDPTQWFRFEVPSGDVTLRKGLILRHRHNLPKAVSADATRVYLYAPPPSNARDRHALMQYDLRNNRGTGFLFVSPVTHVAVSPADGSLAVTCLGDRRVYRRNAEEGLSQRTTLTGHEDRVQALAFSPDGRHLATGSLDGTVRVWESLTDRLVTTIDGHGDCVTSVAFSPDGRLLASGSAGTRENCVLLWDLMPLMFAVPEEQQEELEYRYRQLADTNPQSAYAAIAALRTHETAWNFLREKVRDITDPVEPRAISEWIDQLDDDRFSVRDAASRQLLRIRSVAEPELRRALTMARSVEMRARLRRILDSEGPLKSVSESENRQVQRLIYLLEIRGGTESRQLLQALATGHSDPSLVRAAKAAGDRMRVDE